MITIIGGCIISVFGIVTFIGGIYIVVSQLHEDIDKKKTEIPAVDKGIWIGASAEITRSTNFDEQKGIELPNTGSIILTKEHNILPVGFIQELTCPMYIHVDEGVTMWNMREYLEKKEGSFKFRMTLSNYSWWYPGGKATLVKTGDNEWGFITEAVEDIDISQIIN